MGLLILICDGMPIYSKELGQAYKVFKENGNTENEISLQWKGW